MKFLYFIVFVFKPDSVFINNTKEKEGFANIKEILSPKTKQDKAFERYYLKNHIKCSEKKAKKNGNFWF